MRKLQKTIISFSCLFLGLMPQVLHAQNGLVGIWYVKCTQDGQIDRVDCTTGNHYCSKNYHHAFSDGQGYVVCPYGHDNWVSGQTQSKKCTHRDENGNACGAECRRDPNFTIYTREEDLRADLKRKNCPLP